jgi:hypothetical protein
MPANLFAAIRPYEDCFLSLFTTLHHSVILRREIRVFLRME